MQWDKKYRVAHVGTGYTGMLALTFSLNGGELPGSAATAARAVNAIPAVCAADPGILSALDLVVPAQGSMV